MTTLQGGPKKMYLRVDNFATVRSTKAFKSYLFSKGKETEGMGKRLK